MFVDGRPAMVHVAAVGENRGRVVLRLGTAEPHRIAVEAALRVARAYQASLESLFVENQQLLDLAAHDDRQEVSLCGRQRRSLSAAVLLRQFAFSARQAERRIAAMARIAAIPYGARTLRDEPLHALNRACAEAGPWNVIVFADAIKSGDRRMLLDLMNDVVGVTGFVLVAPAAQTTHGPIVIVIEDTARLPQMFRAAERLAHDADVPVVALLSAVTDQATAAMDHDARLVLGARADVTVRAVPAVHGDPAALAEVLRRLKPGFVIGQAGGQLLPRDAPWGSLAQTLPCPLFIAR